MVEVSFYFILPRIQVHKPGINILPFPKSQHLQDLRDLHQVRPGNIGNRCVDNSDRVGIHHCRTDEQVEDDVHANGINFTGFRSARGHKQRVHCPEKTGQARGKAMEVLPDADNEIVG